MLGRILREMNNSREPLSVLEISRRLGIDRSALEGILETLVRLGKLKQVSVGEAGCGYGGACSACSSCLLYCDGGKAKAIMRATASPSDGGAGPRARIV